jgi:hypothetical protein
MAAIEFYSNGRLHRLAARLPGDLAAPKTRGASVMGMKLVAESGPVIIRAIRGQSSRLESLFHDVSQSSMLISLSKAGDAAVVPTATVIVEGASTSELKKMKEDFGLEMLAEGSEGKVLLRVPEGGEKGVKQAAVAAPRTSGERPGTGRVTSSRTSTAHLPLPPRGCGRGLDPIRGSRPDRAASARDHHRLGRPPHGKRPVGQVRRVGTQDEQAKT